MRYLFLLNVLFIVSCGIDYEIRKKVENSLQESGIDYEVRKKVESSLQESGLVIDSAYLMKCDSNMKREINISLINKDGEFIHKYFFHTGTDKSTRYKVSDDCTLNSKKLNKYYFILDINEGSSHINISIKYFKISSLGDCSIVGKSLEKTIFLTKKNNFNSQDKSCKLFTVAKKSMETI